MTNKVLVDSTYFSKAEWDMMFPSPNYLSGKEMDRLGGLYGRSRSRHLVGLFSHALRSDISDSRLQRLIGPWEMDLDEWLESFSLYDAVSWYRVGVDSPHVALKLGHALRSKQGARSSILEAETDVGHKIEDFSFITDNAEVFRYMSGDRSTPVPRATKGRIIGMLYRISNRVGPEKMPHYIKAVFNLLLNGPKGIRTGDKVSSEWSIIRAVEAGLKYGLDDVKIAYVMYSQFDSTRWDSTSAKELLRSAECGTQVEILSDYYQSCDDAGLSMNADDLKEVWPMILEMSNNGTPSEWIRQTVSL